MSTSNNPAPHERRTLPDDVYYLLELEQASLVLVVASELADYGAVEFPDRSQPCGHGEPEGEYDVWITGDGFEVYGRACSGVMAETLNDGERLNMWADVNGLAFTYSSDEAPLFIAGQDGKPLTFAAASRAVEQAED
jgi:hypothetical protein